MSRSFGTIFTGAERNRVYAQMDYLLRRDKREEHPAASERTSKRKKPQARGGSSERATPSSKRTGAPAPQWTPHPIPPGWIARALLGELAADARALAQIPPETRLALINRLSQ